MDETASRRIIEEQVKKLETLESVGMIQDVALSYPDLFFSFICIRDNRAYRVHFRCDGYPVQAPSVGFVSLNGSQKYGIEDWPNDGDNAIKRSSTPRFICLPGIREYYERHREASFTEKDIDLLAITARLLGAVNK